MTTRKKSDESLVDTGGGAYVGGDVNTRGGDFTGRDKKTDNSVTIGGNVSGSNIVTGNNNQIQQPQSSGAELADLLKLLQELKSQVVESGLPAHQQKIAEASIEGAETEAQQQQPKGNVITGALKYVSDTLEAAGTLTEKGKNLLSGIKSALDLAGALF